MDERQIRLAMKRMGINFKEIEAEKIIIETKDKEYIFEKTIVGIMDMKGKKIYQISGEPKIRTKIREEDVEMVAEKTGKSKEEARKALEEVNGDIAQAIINLSS